MPETELRRIDANANDGLTSKQVQERVEAGADNSASGQSTVTTGKIIRTNVFTVFNGVNFGLAMAVIAVGAPKEALFFGVAVANTLMGIFQELRAKRTLDKLAVLAQGKVMAVRNKKEIEIGQDEVVLDDILVLKSGNQIPADATILKTDGFAVDESLLTGESNSIQKEVGDEVLSGSFVVLGQAHVRVTAVGKESYAGKLAAKAKQAKKPTAPLMQTLNRIIKVLAFVIVPVGAMLFWQQYDGSGDLQRSVLGSAAAMVGMIPEGLILLTGVTMTLGALKLAKRKALVQTLPSIETLARVDTLCLDKTGTITDGTLSFEKVVPKQKWNDEKLSRALGEMMGALKDENATAEVLRDNFQEAGDWQVTRLMPFDSEKKWSGVSFEEHGSFVLGAPSFVIKDNNEKLLAEVKEYAKNGQRVLVLAHSDDDFKKDGLPEGLKVAGLIILSDHIRPEAKKTFEYFRHEGVTLKVISGDDAQTVSVIAGRAGIEHAENYIDLGTILAAELDYEVLVRKYTVFGRVKPEQKKSLIAALKAQKHTVCMTGDGVNDVLALKEADCGVAMISGSDAARASADFVLMTSDFSAMIDVLKEGRRVINNIENVASLYLVKTIYSTLLALIYAIVPFPYPFTPLQMTPINMFTVGIPSFFLAFRESYEKPKGRFLINVIENAMPAAVVIVINIALVQLFGWWFNLPQDVTSTTNVILTASIGFVLLYKVAKPLRWIDGLMIGLVAAGYLVCLIGFKKFFGYAELWQWGMLICLPLLILGPWAFNFASARIHEFIVWRAKRKARR